MTEAVRPCAPGEVQQVLDLWAAARSAHATTHDDTTVVERLLAADPEALLVVERDGRVVGVVIATWDGWRGHLYRLAVVPEERAEGLWAAAGYELEESVGRWERIL